MEAKLALTEVALESGDKLAAKDATEHPDGKEEGIARFDPAGTVEGESAGGHHTMDMGVMFELLIPSVEHAKEADLGTEMFGIASDFEKGFGTGLQQEMVEDLLVLQSQRRQFMRQGEDKMDVTRGEKFLTTRLHPTLRGRWLDTSGSADCGNCCRRWQDGTRSRCTQGDAHPRRRCGSARWLAAL